MVQTALDEWIKEGRKARLVLILSITPSELKLIPVIQRKYRRKLTQYMHQKVPHVKQLFSKNYLKHLPDFLDTIDIDVIVRPADKDNL